MQDEHIIGNGGKGLAFSNNRVGYLLLLTITTSPFDFEEGRIL